MVLISFSDSLFHHLHRIGIVAAREQKGVNALVQRETDHPLTYTIMTFGKMHYNILILVCEDSSISDNLLSN